jgi:hypothetical protein
MTIFLLKVLYIITIFVKINSQLNYLPLCSSSKIVSIGQNILNTKLKTIYFMRGAYICSTPCEGNSYYQSKTSDFEMYYLIARHGETIDT